MDILIATATLYGNKVRYLESDGQFSRTYVSVKDAPLLFSDKKNMFQEELGWADHMPLALAVKLTLETVQAANPIRFAQSKNIRLIFRRNLFDTIF